MSKELEKYVSSRTLEQRFRECMKFQIIKSLKDLQVPAQEKTLMSIVPRILSRRESRLNHFFSFVSGYLSLTKLKERSLNNAPANLLVGSGWVTRLQNLFSHRMMEFFSLYVLFRLQGRAILLLLRSLGAAAQ